MGYVKYEDGIWILNRYMINESDRNNGTSDGEIVWFGPTDLPVEDCDIRKLIKLGWHQDSLGEFNPENYDHSERWFFDFSFIYE